MSLSVLFSNLTYSYPLDLDFSELIESIESLDFSADIVNSEDSGQVVKRLIESVYTDGITGLQNVVVNGQNIEGIFLDQVSPSLTRKFKFTISPTRINYEMLNPDAQNFSESVDFAKAKAPKSGGQTVADKNGRVRNCTEGRTYPCGKVCRANGKPCSQPLSTEQGAAQKEVVKKAKASGKSKLVDQSEVTPKSKTSQKKSDISVDKSKTLDDSGNTKQVKGETDMNVPTTEIKDNRYGLSDISAIADPSSKISQNKLDKLAKQILADGVKSANPVILIGNGVIGFKAAANPDNELLAAAYQRAKQLDPKAELAPSYVAKNQEEADAMLYQRQVAGKYGTDNPSAKGSEFKLIDVAAVKSVSKPDDISDDDLNNLAISQTKVGNRLPLVLKEVGFDSYEVVSGDVAMLAAQKAKQLNPRGNEMVNAFVIPFSKAANKATKDNTLVPTTRIERNDQAQKIVAVKKLNVPEKSGTDIDNLAKAQLLAKVQFPIVVQRDGAGFNVLTGQKVAAASQKAKQLDINLAENTRVFIANDDDEAQALTYQTQFLNEPSGKGKPPSVDSRVLDKVNVDQLGVSQLVGIKKISSTNDSSFDSETVDKLANSMLRVGNIMPIVIQRDSENPLTKFNLVHGELALAAAKRAKEIDPKAGEMVRVFIADNDQESALLKYQSGTEKI